MCLVIEGVLVYQIIAAGSSRLFFRQAEPPSGENYPHHMNSVLNYLLLLLFMFHIPINNNHQEVPSFFSPQAPSASISTSEHVLIFSSFNVFSTIWIARRCG